MGIAVVVMEVLGLGLNGCLERAMILSVLICES